MAILLTLTCFSLLILQQCTAFVHPAFLQSTTLRPFNLHIHVTNVANHRPAASSTLSMAAKKSGSGGSGGSSKRKRKKASAAEGGGRTTTASDTAVTSPPIPSSSAGDGDSGGFEDAGAPMMASGGVGFVDVKIAKRGELLKDGDIGSDEAREAKIEETLRKMGVKSIGEVRTANAKDGVNSVERQITSILDLIPAETQLLMERVFIAGFAACLIFLVGCGCAIGVEAYLMSTQGKLPPDLDNFIVQRLEPLFTPSLGATFLFSSLLGVLKLGQMGQESVVYREDD